MIRKRKLDAELPEPENDEPSTSSGKSGTNKTVGSVIINNTDSSLSESDNESTNIIVQVRRYNNIKN